MGVPEPVPDSFSESLQTSLSSVWFARSTPGSLFGSSQTGQGLLGPHAIWHRAHTPAEVCVKLHIWEAYARTCAHTHRHPHTHTSEITPLIIQFEAYAHMRAHTHTHAHTSQSRPLIIKFGAYTHIRAHTHRHTLTHHKAHRSSFDSLEIWGWAEGKCNISGVSTYTPTTN